MVVETGVAEAGLGQLLLAAERKEVHPGVRFFVCSPQPAMSLHAVVTCCLCLVVPAVLPVRPHGDGLCPCGCVMCQTCYREWRHHHGWPIGAANDRTVLPSKPPPACPCCRLSVHPHDVPPDWAPANSLEMHLHSLGPNVPDVLLVGLLSACPVTCPTHASASGKQQKHGPAGCDAPLNMGQLADHLAFHCTRSILRWLGDLHPLDQLTTTHFCISGVLGRHGTAPDGPPRPEGTSAPTLSVLQELSMGQLSGPAAAAVSGCRCLGLRGT